MVLGVPVNSWRACQILLGHRRKFREEEEKMNVSTSTKVLLPDLFRSAAGATRSIDNPKYWSRVIRPRPLPRILLRLVPSGSTKLYILLELTVHAVAVPGLLETITSLYARGFYVAQRGEQNSSVAPAAAWRGHC